MPLAYPAVDAGGDALIAYLRGNVLRATAEQVIVDVGGVGYAVNVPTSVRQAVPPPGEQVELHIHTHVREDQLALFGFATPEELAFFRMLIEVDGVGPKVALGILGSAHLDILKRAILTDDVAPIRRAPGVGPRTAAKVIIELKPRLEAEEVILALPKAVAAAKDGKTPKQVEDALRGLGFTPIEAKRGLEAVDWAGSPDLQVALATALKALGTR